MVARLKLTKGFNAVYRYGKWARGGSLSVGFLLNNQKPLRVGLRLRRGVKGSTVRNRLKRQLRAHLQELSKQLRTGIDLVIVIHPKRIPIESARLKEELYNLCNRSGLISQARQE